MRKRYVNTPVAGLKSLPLPAQPLVLALVVVCLLAVRPLSAEPELVIGDRVAVDLGIKAAAGYFGTWNTNFGLGRLDFRTGANTGDAHWGEAYLEPSVDAELALDGWGHLYGGISGVGVLTEGDGDAGGFTNDGDDDLDLEHLFIGWRSFSEATGEPTLDLSFGRQEFRIGNGFLIYDGDLDQLEKGASWLSPRDSFERAGLVRLDMAPAHADLFYLNADRDHDETALAGFNFEYAFQDPTRVGFTYLYIFDSTPRFWGVRAGMNVLDLRVNELALPYLPEISFSGEYVKEIGDGKDGEIDAEGWYAGLTYAPAEWPWTPSLSYRYSSFSGDPDPNDTIRRDFDPLFYGWTGWGTWYQGEITGEWLLFNSNQRTHLVHLKLAPREDVSVGILYFKFGLAENDYFSTPVTDGDFTDEVNLYADWTLTDYASISAVYGAAFPGEAARQAFGDDEVYHLFEVVLYLTF